MTATGKLLAYIDRFVAKYVVLPSADARTAVALFVAHTWAFDDTWPTTTPYVVLLSPEKRSGKTRLLEVLELLVREPWRCTSPSEASLYRKIEQDRPTLLLDEVDAIFTSATERTEPLRALLNAGNRRGSFVPRCVGRSAKVIDFSVFGPKVLAGIDTGRFPDTIKDRAVVVSMRRRTGAEPVERFLARDVGPLAEQLRAALDAWAGRHLHHLADARPGFPAELNDRTADAWEPLLAIADLAGGDWPRNARLAALALAAGEADEEGPGPRLLAATRAAFNGHARMSTTDLLAAVNENAEAGFGGWNDGAGLTARRLSTLLKPYGVRPRQWRQDGPSVRGYRRDDFADAWDRYLGDDGVPGVPGVPEFSEQTSLNDLGPERPLPPATPDALPATRCRCASPLIVDDDGETTCARCGRRPTTKETAP